MTPDEIEQARRLALIKSAYANYLGTYDPDQAGLNYWLGQAAVLNNDQKLTDAIAYAGGASRAPGLSAQVLSDPTYASWFRGMQMDESSAQSALAAARDNAFKRIAAQNGMYDQQQKQASRNIDDNAEARGMYRSGGRLMALADSTNEFDRQRAAYQNSVTDQITEQERETAQRVADLRRQNAEQILAARTRLSTNTIGAPI